MGEDDFDVIVTIGLDFGSSTTKVGYRIQSVDIDKSDIVKFSGEDTSLNGLLRNSVMYASEGWAFLSQNRFPNSQRVSYFKSALLNSSIKEEQSKLIKDFCSLYLSSVIGASKTYIEKTEIKVLKNHHTLWIVSIGVPVDQQEIELNKTYEEMAHVAVLQYKLVSGLSLISREKWHELYIGSRDKPLRDVHYHLIPELLAEVTDVFEDPEVDEGLSMVIDIGSATVDIAIVDLDRHTSDAQYGISFISAKVGSIGVDNTVKYIEKSNGQKQEGRVKKALMVPEAYGKIYTLMNKHPYNIDDLDCYGKTLVGKFYGFYADTCMQVKKSSLEQKFSSMKSMRLYLLGGGNCYHWYRVWPEKAYNGRRLEQCNVPKGQIQNLHNQVGFTNLDSSLYHRFRVASGLLKHETMLKVIGYPHHFKTDNHSFQRVTLHESLENIMAEKYGR